MVNILKAFNRTGSFWVGASDFERGQRFTWFNNGSELMLEELDVMPEEDKDQRCIQVRERAQLSYCAVYSLPSRCLIRVPPHAFLKTPTNSNLTSNSPFGTKMISQAAKP